MAAWRLVLFLQTRSLAQRGLYSEFSPWSCDSRLVGLRRSLGRFYRGKSAGSIAKAMVRPRKGNRTKKSPPRRRRIAAIRAKAGRGGAEAHRDTAARSNYRSTRSTFIAPRSVPPAPRCWARRASRWWSKRFARRYAKPSCSMPTRRAGKSTGSWRRVLHGEIAAVIRSLRWLATHHKLKTFEDICGRQ